MRHFEFHPDGLEELEFEQANELVQSRQRFRRKEKSASFVLNQLLARKGYLQQKSNNELAVVWDSIVEDRWKAKTKVGNVNRGVLDIFVKSSPLANHLDLKKRKLLQQLQEKLPQNKIKDIRFRVGSV